MRIRLFLLSFFFLGNAFSQSWPNKPDAGIKAD